MKPIHLIPMLAVALASASHAAAQCPDVLPQSVINSVRNPEARAAAQSMRISATMISQAGGLPTMIAQVKGQIAADQATAAEEQRNQTYLAQNGMANDKRAADGRLVIQLMEDAHRLNAATLQILECHARTSGTGSGASLSASGSSRESSVASSGVPSGVTRTPVMLPGAASTASMSAALTTAKSAFLSRGTAGDAWEPHGRPSQPPADLGHALDDLTRVMRDKAMTKASPEVAAFYAKQDAMRANNEANMAAMNAGRLRGLDDARRGSVDAQMKMVTGVVKGWRAPEGYAAGAAIDGSAILDPFAAEAKIDAVESAMEKSGLVWDRSRGLARVGENRTLCGGRLQLGDYPVLIDGTLLDTPDRIGKFLSVCGDVTMPLLVVRESGDVEVRK